MASIRRTLSPVPRTGGTLSNGEACQVPSPLSKSSTISQHYQPSGGLLSSLFGLSDPQGLVLGVLSPKTSRTIERSKSKGQIWRRALLHFSVCFVVGLFIGLTPFVSMNFSANLMPNQQPLAFDVVSDVGSVHSVEGISRNLTLVAEREGVKDNATEIELKVKQKESVNEISVDNLMNEISVDNLMNQSLPQDMDLLVKKLLIIVTPTCTQPLQAYYLNRLAHTLKLVQPPLLWILVEMTSQSEQTADILRRTGVIYRHLVCNKNLTDMKDRNVHLRNVALSHIETHRLDGIVYFADEDNIYSVDLFEQMRQIRRFGTWTVAKLMGSESQALLEGPVCDGTKVNGWHLNDSTRRVRRFHADMAGFAFNSTILWDPKRWHRPTPEPIRQLDPVRDGFQVSSFVEQVVEDESQMECLLEDSSRVLVWQLHLESSDPFYPQKWFLNSNLDTVGPLA